QRRIADARFADRAETPQPCDEIVSIVAPEPIAWHRGIEASSARVDAHRDRATEPRVVVGGADRRCARERVPLDVGRTDAALASPTAVAAMTGRARHWRRTRTAGEDRGHLAAGCTRALQENLTAARFRRRQQQREQQRDHGAPRSLSTLSITSPIARALERPNTFFQRPVGSLPTIITLLCASREFTYCPSRVSAASTSSSLPVRNNQLLPAFVRSAYARSFGGVSLRASTVIDTKRSR